MKKFINRKSTKKSEQKRQAASDVEVSSCPSLGFDAFEDPKEYSRGIYDKKKQYRDEKEIPKLVKKYRHKEWTDQQREFMHKYGPQSGYNISHDILLDLARNISSFDSFDPKICKKIEHMVVSIYLISKAKDVGDVIATVTLFLNDLTNSSMTLRIKDFIASLFETKVDCSSEVLDRLLSMTAEEVYDWEPQAGIAESMLSALNDLASNWSLIANHPLKKQVCLLCTALVSAGFCSADSFNWTIGKVRIFSGVVADRFLNGKDLIDAVLSVMKYTLEVGVLFFKTGDFKVFFKPQNEETFEMEEEMIFLETSLQHLRSGRLGEMTGLSDNDFLLRIERCVERYKVLLREMPRGPPRVSVEQDLTRMTRVFETARGLSLGDSQRMCPMGIKLDGASGVGKSQVMDIIVRASLKAMGYQATDDSICTLDSTDKFDSHYNSSHSAVIMDDVANTNSDFVNESPLWQIIRFINNQPQTALKAEAELKGIVPIMPKFVGVTTNVANLDAHKYSNSTASILRRFNMHVTVSVKREFVADYTGEQEVQPMRIDPEKVYNHYTDKDGNLKIPELQNVWLFDVYEYVEVTVDSPTKSVVVSQPLQYKDKKALKLNVYELVDLVVQRSLQHKKNQEIYLENQKNKKFDMCEKCNRPIEVCEYLSLCEKEPQSGRIKSVYSKARAGVHNVKSKARTVLSEMDIVSLDEISDLFYTYPLYFYCLICNNISLGADGTLLPWIITLFRDYFGDKRMCQFIYNTMIISIVLLFLSFVHYLFLVVFFGNLYISVKFLKHIEVELVDEYAQRRNRFEHFRDNVFRKMRKNLLIGGVAASMLCLVVTLVRSTRRSVYFPQGNLNPATQKEVDDRDEEKNPWAKVSVSPLPGTNKQKAQTHEQAVERCSQNLVFLSYTPVKGEDLDKKTDAPHQHETIGFIMRSNTLLLPHHMWFPDSDCTKTPYVEIRCLARFKEDNNVSSKMPIVLSYSRVSHANDTDLCLCHVTRLGSRKDLVWMLPSGPVGTVQGTLVLINKKGERTSSSSHVKDQMVNHSKSQTPFQGSLTTLGVNTQIGMCGAPLVASSKGNQIAGIHVAGKSGSNLGMIALYTQEMFAKDAQRLSSQMFVIKPMDEGTFMDPQIGVPVMVSKSIHPKCPTQYMTDDHYLPNVFGSCCGKVTPRTSVITTPISDSVTKYTGVERLYDRPPDMTHWRHFQRWTHNVATVARHSINQEALDWACRDYMQPIIKLLHDFPKLRSEMKPLGFMQTLVGIDGKRFIDRMPFSTSIGFPVGGPKTRIITIADPLQYPGVQAPVELDEEYVKEFYRMETEFACGRRAYPVFSSHLKDEPVKIGKDKVRVFNAVGICFSMLVRKYFLPVLRLISLFPLVTECCVGINVEGTEWDELIRHIEEFGEERCFGADYKLYDQTLPVELCEAMLSILINIARLSGNYTERDLKIMNGIATEVMFPYIALNGTLIEAVGVWVSGINLTAHGGSIQNSLLQRTFFFTQRRKLSLSTRRFQDVVHVSTLGDDLKGTVRPGHDYFNMVDYHEYCANLGITTTMPDKDSELVPFMKTKDCDFLKRITRWDPERGVYVAMLDESSIFKRLHVMKHPKECSVQEQVIENIETCLRDWSLYPENVFELRRSQLKQICAENDLIVPFTTLSYRTHLSQWYDKYIVSDDSSEELVTSQTSESD